MIKYFVSFYLPNIYPAGRFNCAEVAMTKPISSMDDIALIIDDIKKQYKNPWMEITVISWCRFENPQPAEYGMKCPRCGYLVDDADYWAGDKCLRCAMEIANKEE